jgi:Holliday junction resolvase RusA-like endonuclease
MRLYCSFAALGFVPTPWQPPHHGSGVSKGGKRFHFKRPANPDTERWQNFVRRSAIEHVANVPILQSGAVRLELIFYLPTPVGGRHGELFTAPVRWNDEKGKYTKVGQPADLTNLIKGTEDALEGVVFANDCQVRSVSAVTLCGPEPGVRVTVSVMEPSDYQGVGEPVTESWTDQQRAAEASGGDAPARSKRRSRRASRSAPSIARLTAKLRLPLTRTNESDLFGPL